jgi:hypothetical protein
MANSKRDIDKPTNPPLWKSTGTEPSIPDTIEEGGYVSGDLPEHEDINYIGWNLTKWVEWIKQNLIFNNKEVDSVAGTFERRADTGYDKNYPANPTTIPEGEILPNMNRRMDLKISTMCDTVIPTYIATTKDEFDAEKTDATDATGHTDLDRNINLRINTKITEALANQESLTIPGGEVLPLIIENANITRSDGGDADSRLRFPNNGYIVMARFGASGDYGWSDKILESITAGSYNFIETADATDTGVTGVKVEFGDNGLYGFSSSADALSSKSTVHIFAVKAVGYPLAFIATTNISSAGLTDYRNYYSAITTDPIYARRICSTKVLDTKQRGSAENASYKLLQLEQSGDEAYYDSLIRKRGDGAYSYSNDTISTLTVSGSLDMTDFTVSLNNTSYKYYSRYSFTTAGGIVLTKFNIKGNFNHPIYIYEWLSDNITQVITKYLPEFRDTAKILTTYQPTGASFNDSGTIRLFLTGHTDSRID